jgi:hypothetical protein
MRLPAEWNSNTPKNIGITNHQLTTDKLSLFFKNTYDTATNAGIVEAGNDHGRVAKIQSFFVAIIFNLYLFYIYFRYIKFIHERIKIIFYDI